MEITLFPLPDTIMDVVFRVSDSRREVLTKIQFRPESDTDEANYVSGDIFINIYEASASLGCTLEEVQFRMAATTDPFVLCGGFKLKWNRNTSKFHLLFMEKKIGDEFNDALITLSPRGNY